MVTGAAPRARSASMTPAMWSIHLLHERRPQLAHLGVGGPGRMGGQRHRAVRAKRRQERVDAVAPGLRHVVGHVVGPALHRRIGLDDDALEQREQHRVLGREVEVERRPRQTRSLGEVVDGDVGERPLLKELLGRRQERLFALVTRRARGATAARCAGLAEGRHGT